MKLVVVLKGRSTEGQRRVLLQAMERFNKAANWVAGVAFEHRTASKYKLQKLVYHEVRNRFGLSAQMTLLCIAKVAEAYKRDKSVGPEFRKRGALVYDERTMSFKAEDSLVSLLTLEGRKFVPLCAGDYQRRRLKGLRRGQADLIYRNDTFYLALTVNVPEPPPDDPEGGALGVDLGIVNLATDSDGETHTGECVEKVRARYERIRHKLQKASTKSAKRHLEKLVGREKRFRRDVNHRISKKLVGKAKETKKAVALEDLRHLRKRTTVRKSQRSRHSSWSYHQPRSFVEYKARLAGALVYFVDPRNTSRTCSECGHCEKANRKSRGEFVCKSCGFAAPADANAARNVAARAEIVMRPIVSLAGAS